MGLGMQLIHWDRELCELFADRGFHVIRFDNRDTGLSTKMSTPPPTRRQVFTALLNRRFAHSAYDLGDMSDDTAGLLDHLGIERAHVVGVSMGGMIGQTLAIRHSRRVASLTSIMSNTGDRRRGRIHPALLRRLPSLMSRSPDDSITNGIEVFRLIAGPHFDGAAMRELTEEAFQRSYDADGLARQAMAVAASPDRTWDLRPVTAPTLVIHGLVDRLVLPSGGIATAMAVPGSRLVMYPDMGHDLPRPRWDEIIDEIVENTRRAGPDGGVRARVA
jgi:pimeloyl-ACP methyl ester carboxylesterase